MRKLAFKSISGRIILTIIAMNIMAMIVLSMLTYDYSKSLVHQELSIKIDKQLSTML